MIFYPKEDIDKHKNTHIEALLKKMIDEKQKQIEYFNLVLKPKPKWIPYKIYKFILNKLITLEIDLNNRSK